MIDLLAVLILILSFFVLALGLRQIGFKFCALCASVSLTWILLLVLFWFGFGSVDPVLLSILIGGSVVGLMYFMEKRLPEDIQIFKLPFYLTALTLTYMAVTLTLVSALVLGLLILLWSVYGFLYFGQDHFKKLKVSVRRLIECCRDW
jgi:hypothetical protein